MNKLTAAVVMLTVFLLAGCASTQQARHVETDSFLAPYATLLVHDDSGKRALLHYNNPNTDWTSYQKMELKPVLLLTNNESDLSSKQREQLQGLVNDFYVELYQDLSRYYTMVSAPDSGVLQMQVAISHGTPSHAALAFVSKLPSPARLVNTAWSKVSGKPAFSGGVTLELVIKDAETNTLLAAAADRRVGSMRLFEKGALSSWDNVHDALQFYAKAITYRLCKAQGNGNCQKP